MSEHAAELAEQLLRYPRRHCVAGPFLFLDFDAAAVSAAIRAMLPSPAAAVRVDAMIQQYDVAGAAVSALPGAAVRAPPDCASSPLCMPCVLGCAGTRP